MTTLTGFTQLWVGQHIWFSGTNEHFVVRRRINANQWVISPPYLHQLWNLLGAMSA